MVQDPKPNILERLKLILDKLRGVEASPAPGNPLLYLKDQAAPPAPSTLPAMPKLPIDPVETLEKVDKVVKTMEEKHVGPSMAVMYNLFGKKQAALYDEDAEGEDEEKSASALEDPTGNLKRFEEPKPKPLTPPVSVATLPKGKIPTTGPEAVHYALSQLDTDQLYKEQMDIVRRKLKSKRPNAVKVLGYLEGFKRMGIQPADLMITKVPVIPPKFRPFSVTGDTFQPGDANELYRDLINIKDAQTELEGVLGPRGAAAHKLTVYDAVKAAYGYGEPTNPKTRERGASGFLQKIVGQGSSKYSFPQRVLLGKNQDSVGRGVIGVDPNLDLDEIAIPEEMAWKLYAPYIQRRLVRNGMAPGDAITMIRDRAGLARKHMELETRERPVIYSRAPSWHRFNVISGYPRIIPGNTILINPLVTTGMTADFDGNCIIGSSKIFVAMTLSAWQDHGMKISSKSKIHLKSDKVIAEIEIKDFPRIGAPIKDRNGADTYAVPTGISVWSGDLDGKGARWSNVTGFTVEEGCELRKVSLSSKKEVTASSNESIAVYASGGKIVRCCPDSAFNQLVPVLRRLPVDGTKYDTKFGWLLGAFLSDGWVSSKIVGYTKVSAAHRLKFIDCFAHITGQPALYRSYSATHEAASNCGIDGLSQKIHINAKTEAEMALAAYLAACITPKENRNSDARACIFKHMPSDLYEFSRPALLGLLAGLLDGDGSLSLNCSRKSPQVIANISTSSPELKDGIICLLRLLGMRASFSTLMPKKGRPQKHPNYVISISTPDLSGVIHELPVFENPAVLQLRSKGVMKDDRDIVPVDREFLSRLKHQPSGVDRSMAGNLAQYLSCSKYLGYAPISRLQAQRLLDLYQDKSDEFYATLHTVTSDKTIGWERVVKVTPVATETVYDLVVPETKVFALSSGMVIYDTMNVHLPSMSDAVKDAKEKLLPSKMLWSIKKYGDVVPVLKQELVLGLYQALHRPAKNKWRFRTEAEALKAIKAGQVALSDEVEIG